MPTRTDKTLAQQVIELISHQMEIPEEGISLDSNFVRDLGFDSLDKVEFIMAVEERFNITVPDAAAEKIETVGQAVAEIEKVIAKKADGQQTVGT